MPGFRSQGCKLYVNMYWQARLDLRMRARITWLKAGASSSEYKRKLAIPNTYKHAVPGFRSQGCKLYVNMYWQARLDLRMQARITWLKAGASSSEYTRKLAIPGRWARGPSFV